MRRSYQSRRGGGGGVRRLLLPIMAIIELCALAVGWALSLMSESAAIGWCELCLRLFPDRDWYTSPAQPLKKGPE
jgi:hypothetical protein